MIDGDPDVETRSLMSMTIDSTRDKRSSDDPPKTAVSVPLIANFALFQAVWLVTVLGAARGSVWPGVAALAFFLLAHAALSPTAKVDYVLCVLLVAVGALIESFNGVSGLLVHRDSAFGAAFPPTWMLVLWCNLALILNNSIGWLLNRPVLAGLLGAMGGAASYAAGVALGAAEFGMPTREALPILAATWAIVTPLLMFVARRVNSLAARGVTASRP